MILQILNYKQNNSGLHSQFSQCFPDVPAGHLHCPVTRSHGAPVQLQGCTQPGPNLPSGQSDVGQAEKICVNRGGQSQMSLKGHHVPCRATHLDRSSLHEDPEGIFVGTVLSRDHMTLLVDKHTRSRSLLRKYLGHILETE